MKAPFPWFGGKRRVAPLMAIHDGRPVPPRPIPPRRPTLRRDRAAVTRRRRVLAALTRITRR